MAHVRGAPDAGEDRALASDIEERILLENYYLPGDLEACIGRFVNTTITNAMARA
jgi:hypothetical protein